MKTQIKYFVALIGLLALAQGRTQAAEIIVDADGFCTLSDAITVANTDAATGECPAGFGDDIIVLESDVLLDTALPEITSSVTIEGQGHIIDGNNDPIVGSVLRIDVNGSLTMNNVIITGGNSSLGGGGIYNEGALALTESMVNENTVSCKDDMLSAGGGGIYSIGSLMLTNSMVNGNSVSCDNGEIVFGGGIVTTSNTVATTITNSTISGNSLSCNYCNIDDLIGGVLVGGGIINVGTGSVLTLNNSTVSNNSIQSVNEDILESYSVASGGGIITIGDSTTSINLSNSTVSGNSLACNSNYCLFFSGGGVATWGTSSATPNDTATLISSMIIGKSAVVLSGGTVTLMASIVSGNTASSGNEIDGAVVIGDNFNLLGHSGETNDQAFNDFTPGSSDVNATSDGIDGILIPTELTGILDTNLADNGGPTMTHALVPGSPAIDLDVNCSTGLTEDQRGEDRPDGDGCDAGSFEFSNSLPVAYISDFETSVSTGDIVCVDGSASSDADGDALSYSWELTAWPDGSSAAFDEPSAVAPCFTADLPGTYEVSLIVKDGVGESQPITAEVVATTTLSEAVIATLEETAEVISSLDSEVFDKERKQQILGDKIDQTIVLVRDGLYYQALSKLRNNILRKTDGCIKSGGPDRNDWIRECTSQEDVSNLILEAMNSLDEQII
ncbi:hypothetical protein KKHLCK_03450 [Candidatus Electrothrix laxa]